MDPLGVSVELGQDDSLHCFATVAEVSQGAGEVSAVDSFAVVAAAAVDGERNRDPRDGRKARMLGSVRQQR